MRFFNKLGTVDRLHRSSSTNELEEMALSEVVDFTGEEHHVLWDDTAGFRFCKDYAERGNSTATNHSSYF